jgi:hypothetical protein
MRIRLIGEHVHFSIVALAAGGACGSAALAFVVSQSTCVSAADLAMSSENTYGPVWSRALVFSVVMVVCLAAFGLYSARQRARTIGTVLRIIVAAHGRRLCGNGCCVVHHPGDAHRPGGHVARVHGVSPRHRGWRGPYFHTPGSRGCIQAPCARIRFGPGCITSIAELRRRSDRRGFTTRRFCQGRWRGTRTVPSQDARSRRLVYVTSCAPAMTWTRW